LDDGGLEIQGGPSGVDFKPQFSAYTSDPMYPPYLPIEDWIETDNFNNRGTGGYLHVTCNTPCTNTCIPNTSLYIVQPDPGTTYDHAPIKNNKNDSTNNSLPPYKISSEFDEPQQNLIITYPNPFKNQTTVEFAIKEDCRVTLWINDEHGQRIAVLIDDKEFPKGSYSIPYNGSSLSPGIYSCILQTLNDTKSFKIEKVK